MTQGRRYMNIDDEDLDEAAGYPPQRHQQEQYFDEVLPEQQGFEPEPPQSRFSAVQSEAVKRIQKAKLYETLLSHSLFAAGSAESEILEEVEQELKAIVEEKLEELLGMRSASRRQSVQAELPFDDEQVQALLAVANRALRRTPSLGSTPTPSINPVQNAPQEAAVAQPAPQQPTIVPAGRPQAPVVRRQAPQPQRQPQAAQPAGPRRRRRPTENTSATNRDLSQAKSARRPPRPMPTQAQIDDMNARQAERNSRRPKTIDISDDDPNLPASEGGTSSAHVGALLAKVLQGQRGEE